MYTQCKFRPIFEIVLNFLVDFAPQKLIPTFFLWLLLPFFQNRPLKYCNFKKIHASYLSRFSFLRLLISHTSLFLHSAFLTFPISHIARFWFPTFLIYHICLFLHFLFLTFLISHVSYFPSLSHSLFFTVFISYVPHFSRSPVIIFISYKNYRISQFTIITFLGNHI